MRSDALMRQWKVLIADDELIIREGIKDAIDWGTFNMETVGEAEDGEEAVELALVHSIDILLIDINMPIKNGIEAMKEIREKLPNCKIIVISGYDDFQYAQEAIKVNVEEYLLKPIHPNKLEEIVTKISKDLERDKIEENYIEQINQLMRDNNQVRKTFLQEWIYSDMEEIEIKNHLEILSYPVKIPYSFVVFRLPNEGDPFKRLTNEGDNLYSYLRSNIDLTITAVHVQDYKWLTLINWGEENVHQFFMDVQKTIKGKLGESILGRYAKMDTFYISKLHHKLRKELNKLTAISPLVKETLEYIEKNYTNQDLNLNEIAQQLHVTSVYLSKLIKKELGFSFVQIITSLRLKAAKHYLKNSSLSIKEIAEKCGYDSQHYFSSVFKKSSDMSPKQYRDQINQENI